MDGEAVLYGIFGVILLVVAYVCFTLGKDSTDDAEPSSRGCANFLLVVSAILAGVGAVFVGIALSEIVPAIQSSLS